jgi:hypothetical protein
VTVTGKRRKSSGSHGFNAVPKALDVRGACRDTHEKFEAKLSFCVGIPLYRMPRCGLLRWSGEPGLNFWDKNADLTCEYASNAFAASR